MAIASPCTAPAYKCPGNMILPEHQSIVQPSNPTWSVRWYTTPTSLKKHRYLWYFSMAPLSSRAVALVALSSLLVTYAAAGTFNDSAFTADPNWEDARATWYGAPTGAGPDDDGTSVCAAAWRPGR